MDRTILNCSMYWSTIAQLFCKQAECALHGAAVAPSMTTTFGNLGPSTEAFVHTLTDSHDLCSTDVVRRPSFFSVDRLVLSEPAAKTKAHVHGTAAHGAPCARGSTLLGVAEPPQLGTLSCEYARCVRAICWMSDGTIPPGWQSTGQRP